MMNVLIIEDEESAFENLKRILLKIDSTIQIIEWLQSVAKSIDWLSSHDAPDLIFLDIHLSDDLSFKIFETVKVTSPIIFTTAFDEFAIKAFEVNSIDYLLKPISEENVAKALDKYKASAQPNTASYNQLIKDLNKISAQSNFKERFLVNKGDELVIILTSDIAYFYKDQESFLVLNNGNRYPIKFTLDELNDLLNPSLFFRVNRQFMVRVNAISKITLWFKGKLKLKLSPEINDSVIVSREKAMSFKKWMDQ